METKPTWWGAWFKPWPIEHDKFYEEHKANIFKMEKEYNWEAGTRSVIYSGNGVPTTKFTDNI